MRGLILCPQAQGGPDKHPERVIRPPVEAFNYGLFVFAGLFFYFFYYGVNIFIGNHEGIVNGRVVIVNYQLILINTGIFVLI